MHQRSLSARSHSTAQVALPSSRHLMICMLNTRSVLCVPVHSSSLRMSTNRSHCCIHSQRRVEAETRDRGNREDPNTPMGKRRARRANVAVTLCMLHGVPRAEDASSTTPMTHRPRTVGNSRWRAVAPADIAREVSLSCCRFGKSSRRQKSRRGEIRKGGHGAIAGMQHYSICTAVCVPQIHVDC